MNLTKLQSDNIPNYEINSDWGKSYIWQWKGHNCHWRVLGSSSSNPIVLIHGFGASSSHWRKNAFALAQKGFCVYAIDLLGFGQSSQPFHTKECQLDNLLWSQQLEDFLEKIVQTHKNGKAFLVGNSLGSLVGLTTLVFRRDLVAGLAGAPLPDPAFMQSINFPQNKLIYSIKQYLIKIFFILLPLELIIPLISRTFIIKGALQFAYFKSIKFDKELLQIVSKPAKRKTAARALRNMCIGMSLRHKSITAPVLLESIDNLSNRPSILLIWGSKDNLVPLKLGQLIKRNFPWLSLSIIEDTGHCPHDESPKEFNKYLLDWLEINLMKEPQQQP